LYENIQDVAILIDRPLQIMPFAVDVEKDFIEVPFITRSRAPAAELMGIRLPKFSTPRPHRLIGEDDAAFGHQLFNISVAQAEAEVEPDTVADNLCRKPMTLIQDGWG
jgi:hypothetical protein